MNYTLKYALLLSHNQFTYYLVCSRFCFSILPVRSLSISVFLYVFLSVFLSFFYLSAWPCAHNFHPGMSLGGGIFPLKYVGENEKLYYV